MENFEKLLSLKKTVKKFYNQRELMEPIMRKMMQKGISKGNVKNKLREIIYDFAKDGKIVNLISKKEE